MKRFTCREMGGPCDTVIEGETMEEVAQKGAEHARSMSDPDHQKIVQTMDNQTEDERKNWFDWFRGLWDAKEES